MDCENKGPYSSFQKKTLYIYKTRLRWRRNSILKKKKKILLTKKSTIHTDLMRKKGVTKTCYFLTTLVFTTSP